MEHFREHFLKVHLFGKVLLFMEVLPFREYFSEVLSFQQGIQEKCWIKKAGTLPSLSESKIPA